MLASNMILDTRKSGDNVLTGSMSEAHEHVETRVLTAASTDWNMLLIS